MTHLKPANSGVEVPIPEHKQRPDWQQRVIDEYRTLKEQCGKLASFVAGDAESAFGRLDEDVQGLMRQQLGHMAAYADVLRARIDRFEPAATVD